MHFDAVSTGITPPEPGEIAHFSRFPDVFYGRPDSDPAAPGVAAAVLTRVVSAVSVEQAVLGRRPTRWQTRGKCRQSILDIHLVVGEQARVFEHVVAKMMRLIEHLVGNGDRLIYAG